MLARLPPSSSVTRLTVAAAPAMTCRPTSVEPVKPILRTSGCSTSRQPDDRALADDDVEHALGDPGLERQLAEPHRRQRRQLGGLEHHRVAAVASAGPTFQLAIWSGKFHGVISPTTPSGSWKVTSMPPATGIVSP